MNYKNTDKKKKILYVEHNTDGTIGGSHFSLLFLIEGLNKKRYAPLVVFYQDNYLISRYEKTGCKIIMMEKRKPLNILGTYPRLKEAKVYLLLNILCVAPLLIIQKVYNYIHTFIMPSFRCWYILKKENIDLVHLNNTLLRPQEWIFASLFTKANVVAHERGINRTFPFQPLLWARFIKAIICISDAVRDNLLKNNFRNEKLFRIYNGLDPDKFKVRKRKSEILKEFSINNGTPLVGIVGNIKKWKGQDVVIRAMKHTKEKYPEAKCLIVGGVSETDLYYYESLVKIVKDEYLEDCIIFTGQRKEIPEVVNCMNIMIHASTEPEPFGRTLLEGMALRKPIISTSIGAPLEIVEDGITGILVPPNEPEALADAIMKILSDSCMAERMGQAGYERLLKQFNIKENVQKTEALYESLLSSR